MKIRDVAFVTTALAVAGTMSYGVNAAMAADRPHVVHLCASSSNGALRATPHCHANERAIAVNAQGIQGPAGPQGVPGVQGPPGARGASGVSNYYINTAHLDAAAPGTFTVTAVCNGLTAPIPFGEVLGGGGSGGPITAAVPTPIVDNEIPAQYAVTFQVAAPTTLTAYAICAQVGT